MNVAPRAPGSSACTVTCHHAPIPVAGRHDSARLPACFRGLGAENWPQHSMGWATCTCAEKQVGISVDPQPQDPLQFVSAELALKEAVPCLASRGGGSACTAGRAQGKGQGTSHPSSSVRCLHGDRSRRSQAWPSRCHGGWGRSFLQRVPCALLTWRSSSPLHGHQHLLRRPVLQRDQLPTLPWARS